MQGYVSSGRLGGTEKAKRLNFSSVSDDEPLTEFAA